MLVYPSRCPLGTIVPLEKAGVFLVLPALGTLVLDRGQWDGQVTGKSGLLLWQEISLKLMGWCPGAGAGRGFSWASVFVGDTCPWLGSAQRRDSHSPCSCHRQFPLRVILPPGEGVEMWKTKRYLALSYRCLSKTRESPVWAWLGVQCTR